MKLSAFLLLPILFTASLQASDVDATRALMLKKPTTQTAPANTKNVSALNLIDVMWLKQIKKTDFASQLFFDKDSKSLYAVINPRQNNKTDLLSISTPNTWTKETKYRIKNSSIFKESYLFDYDEKSQKLFGLSVNEVKKSNPKRYEQYLALYNATQPPKHETTKKLEYLNKGSFANDVHLCRDDVILNESALVVYNMKSATWKPSFTINKNNSPRVLFNNKCNTIIASEYDDKAKQAYLKFVEYPFSMNPEKKMPVFTKGTQDKVYHIAIDKKEQYYAVSNYDLKIALYSRNAKALWSKKIETIQCPSQDYITALKFSPSANILAVAQSCGGLTLFDVASGQIVHHRRVPIRINDIAFSPDGKALAFTGGKRQELFTLVTDKENKKIF